MIIFWFSHHFACPYKNERCCEADSPELLSVETNPSTVQALVDLYGAWAVACPMIQPYLVHVSQWYQIPLFCLCWHLLPCQPPMVWWEAESYPYSFQWSWGGQYHFLQPLVEVFTNRERRITLNSCRRRQLPSIPTSWRYRAVATKQLACGAISEMWFE